MRAYVPEAGMHACRIYPTTTTTTTTHTQLQASVPTPTR